MVKLMCESTPRHRHIQLTSRLGSQDRKSSFT